MSAIRYLLLMLLQIVAGVALAQAPPRARPGSPPIDSVRVSFNLPEKTFRVVGNVLDNVSRQPVPKVSVCWSGYPLRKTRTDANGHFVLYLPVARRKYYGEGLLTVQTLYYEASTVVPTDSAKPVTLLLKRNTYQVKPFGCQQLSDMESVSPYATRQLTGYLGTQCAFLIRDSTNREPYKLRAVTLSVGRDGFGREPMRLRIYRYDEQLNAPPGDDLFRENFVICPPNEGVFTYDLSSYDILISGTGFFLAVEYTTGSDSFYCKYPTVNYIPRGLVLHPPCTRADSRTWEYLGGSAWHQVTVAENCWPLYESALSVEVEPASKPRRTKR